MAAWTARTLPAEAFRYPVARQNRSSRRIAEALGGTVFAEDVTAKYEAVIYRIPRPDLTGAPR